MDATLYPITEILAQTGFPTPADFRLGPGRPVPARVVLDEPGWSLYTLDLAAEEAWFTDLPPDLDLSECAFIYIEQHKLARRVLKMSFAALEAVAEAHPAPEKVIYIFSIGRCGSTLISHVLARVPGVLSLSEPAVFPRLIMESYDSTGRSDHPREGLVQLIRACTRLLFRPMPGSGATALAIKFHSQTIFQAELYREAWPGAAFVYLYREAISWVKSMYGMARAYGFPDDPTGEQRLIMWRASTAASDLSRLQRFVDLAADQVPPEVTLAPAWAENMAEYMRQLQAGVPFLALRYDRINDDRTATVVQLLRHCGLPLSAAENAMAAYAADSQAGTKLARDARPAGLSAERVERFRSVLAKHPVYGDPDLVLPDAVART